MLKINDSMSKARKPLGIVLVLLSTSAVAVAAVYTTHDSLPIWLVVAGFVGVTFVHNPKWGDVSMGLTLLFFAILAIAAIFYLKSYEVPMMAFLVTFGAMLAKHKETR